MVTKNSEVVCLKKAVGIWSTFYSREACNFQRNKTHLQNKSIETDSYFFTLDLTCRVYRFSIERLKSWVCLQIANVETDVVQLLYSGFRPFRQYFNELYYKHDQTEMYSTHSLFIVFVLNWCWPHIPVQNFKLAPNIKHGTYQFWAALCHIVTSYIYHLHFQ